MTSFVWSKGLIFFLDITRGGKGLLKKDMEVAKRLLLFSCFFSCFLVPKDREAPLNNVKPSHWEYEAFKPSWTYLCSGEVIVFHVTFLLGFCRKCISPKLNFTGLHNKSPGFSPKMSKNF